MTSAAHLPSRLLTASPRDLLPARWRTVPTERLTGWALTAALTVAVAAFVLATPLEPLDLESMVETAWPTTAQTIGPQTLSVFVPLMVLGSVSAIAAVPVARLSVGLATALAAWPFLTVVLYGSFVGGLWLALVGVAMTAAYTRLRTGALPYLLGVAVIGTWYLGNPTALTWLGHASIAGPGGLGFVLGFALSSAAAIAAAAGLGATLRARAAAAAARAGETTALRERAATAERARLARDLHDAVAHHVSLIAVRAESAPFLHPDLPPAARDTLTSIATDARAALDELRQALAVLRRTQDSADRRPQPGADDVATLVADARAAGQAVAVDGGWSGISAPQGFVLYRSVQEGLTNARRHAPGEPVALTLTQDGSAAGFVLTNPADGLGFVEGTGLAGMRTRVEALGGTVAAAAEPGEFTLRVELPEARA